jgi:hypothetical protein
MASSRWKRFAFFDRNTLSLASEVLEDLIPIGGAGGTSTSTENLNSKNTRSSVRRSMHSLNEAAEASAHDSVSLVVTTASLPLHSKPPAVPGSSAAAGGDDVSLALNDMWSSLTACNPMDMPGNANETERNIQLPSQSQALQDESNVVASTHSVDGLVLVFVTSRDTDRIHCFDVTVRCTPPSTTTTTTTTGKSDSVNKTSQDKDLEDLDGWRGYIAPLQGRTIRTKTSSARGGTSAEDRIVAEHMSGGDDSKTEGIVGIATTRASSGHRPVHMACISETNLVVCVDPHLYLSW